MTDSGASGGGGGTAWRPLCARVLEYATTDADANVPVASWPSLRPLAHQPLRGLDPERPDIGEVRCNSPKDLWKTFKLAAKIAVAWLKKQLRVPTPSPEAPRNIPKHAPAHSPEDDLGHSLIEGMLDHLGEEDIVLGVRGPQVESLEQIEARIREKQTQAKRVEVPHENHSAPQPNNPGNI